MASRPYRRSISFEILANNSPGDGDSSFVDDDYTITDEKAENKPRRRRKKNRRKSSAGDISPFSPLAEDSSSVPNSPLSDLLLVGVPPLEGSSRSLGASPSLLSGEWRNVDSEAVELSRRLTPLASSRPSNSRASGLGAHLQGERWSREASDGTSINVNRVVSLDSLPGHEKSTERNYGDHASGSTQAGHQLYSDIKTLRPAAESLNHEASVSLITAADGNFQADAKGFSEGVLKSRRELPPRAPEFSAANEGSAESAGASGSLQPPMSELRQRVVEKPSDKDCEKSSKAAVNGERKPFLRRESSPTTSEDQLATPPGSKIRLGTFATPQLKDWERLMASNTQDPPPLELSPMQYLVTEVCGGSTLRSTTSVGTEQKRERVYNTMFHVPWRCELLIDVGFVVCLDAFLSLFTVMPARIVMFIWQRLAGLLKRMQLQRPYAAELCDFGCLIVLVVGVAILLQADISIIYHWIRGQGVIKLYVVFNVLEIFDKLCQSFGADVLQVLFNSAMSVECCKSEQLSIEIARFAFDQCIAIVSFVVHSMVIISQAITISAAVNAQNNALLTLLISNNFAEIKSNVFKRMGRDQLHKMAYHDTVERFHIMTHVLFVWAQNVLNAEDSVWAKFFYNAGMVFMCEVMVDVIKHSFLAKFNEVKPAAYSEFLQALCSQTLNSQSHEVHKTLSFVPLAPACVVIRILVPVYAACLPQGPGWWRYPGLLLLVVLTYVTLVLLKVVVGLGLQFHAKWYLKRHPWIAPHPHFE